jgi:hypothetical protein
LKDYLKLHFFNFYSKNERACALLVVSFLLFLRRIDAFTNPQFWAEDVIVFFDNAHRYGIKSLFIPANGYHLIYPRLIALFGLLFPISYSPLIYNLGSLLGVLLVVYHLYSPRIKLPLKWLLAILIVATPMPSTEVFMTITNVQWQLALSLILLMLSEKPSYLSEYLFDYSLILVLGLTGPFIIIFLPLFIMHCLIKRSKHSWILLSLAIFCAVVQSMTVKGLVENSENLLTFFDLLMLFARYILFLFLGTASKELLGQEFWIYGGAIFALLLYIYLTVQSLKKNSWQALFFILAGLLILASFLYRFRGSPDVITQIAPGRYFSIPGITLLWAIILHAAYKDKVCLVLTFLITINLLFFGTDFNGTPFTDFNWARRSRCLEIRESCKIPINPVGWYYQPSTGVFKILREK